MSKNKLKKGSAHSIPTTRISVVVLKDNQDILLVRHRKGNKQYWVLPGGRLEYGETFHECAVREMSEETGLDIQVEKFLFLSEAIAPDRSRHIVNIYVLAKIIGGSMRLGREPVLAGVEFIPLSDLERLTVFPPVGKSILEAAASGFAGAGGVTYLGNLWV